MAETPYDPRLYAEGALQELSHTGVFLWPEDKRGGYTGGSGVTPLGGGDSFALSDQQFAGSSALSRGSASGRGYNFGEDDEARSGSCSSADSTLLKPKVPRFNEARTTI